MMTKEQTRAIREMDVVLRRLRKEFRRLDYWDRPYFGWLAEIIAQRKREIRAEGKGKK